MTMATVIKGRVRALSPHFGLYEDLSMVVCQFVTGIAALFEKKTGLTFIAPPNFGLTCLSLKKVDSLFLI